MRDALVDFGIMWFTFMTFAAVGWLPIMLGFGLAEYSLRVGCVAVAVANIWALLCALEL